MSASSSDLPTSWPWALRNVKHMPPPMSSLSTLGSSASMTASLSETFDAAEHHHVRPLGVAGQPLRAPRPRAAPGRRRSAAAAPARRTRWRACGARRRTRRRRTRRPNAGQLVGERAPLGVVLAGLARVEAQVLQQRDLAVGCSAADGGLRRLADGVRRRSATGAAEQLAEPLGDRARACTSGPARPWAGPRCDRRRPAAPASRSASSVGRTARIRPSSVMTSGCPCRTGRSGRRARARADPRRPRRAGRRASSCQSEAPTSLTRSTRRLE